MTNREKARGLLGLGWLAGWVVQLLPCSSSNNKLVVALQPQDHGNDPYV